MCHPCYDMFILIYPAKLLTTFRGNSLVPFLSFSRHRVGLLNLYIFATFQGRRKRVVTYLKLIPGRRYIWFKFRRQRNTNRLGTKEKILLDEHKINLKKCKLIQRTRIKLEIDHVMWLKASHRAPHFDIVEGKNEYRNMNRVDDINFYLVTTFLEKLKVSKII